MNDYIKYQERINELVKKKQEMFQAHGEMIKVQRQYNEYRKKNPYSKKLNKLRQKVHKRRAELMNLVPNKFVNDS